LSYQAISVAQLMQAEGGRTIERRNGTRAATTFKKLPSASPGAKNMAARTASTRFLSARDAECLSQRLTAPAISKEATASP
jgi:hypothetical protein